MAKWVKPAGVTTKSADDCFDPKEVSRLAQALHDSWCHTNPDANVRSDWQAENEAAAKVVVKIVREQQPIDLSDEQQRLRAGRQIHDAWLTRNPWARGSELDKPFDELSPEEQTKDIDQLIVAQRILR